MPLPFLIAIAAGTALLGIGKTIKAGVDNHEASQVNESANDIIESAKNKLNTAKNSTFQSLDKLGRVKVDVIQGSITPFISVFEKIKNIDYTEIQSVAELKNFKVDSNTIKDLKEMGNFANSLGGGAVGGAVGGALAAFGAYGAAMTFGAASTGTAIASLSGVSATNATLAFLGGGSLAAGGLGMAGGAAVLGGLVAGPALAIFGFVLGAQASANRDNAYSNLAAAKKFREEMNLATTLCNSIAKKAELFINFLFRMDARFQLENRDFSAKASGFNYNYQKFDSNTKRQLAALCSFVKAIQTVLNTSILDKEGNLIPNCGNVIDEMNQLMLTAR